LLGDANLPVAVLTCKGLTRAELARLRYARHHPLGIAGADPIQRFAGDDVEIPGLGVHRRRSAHRQTDDFLDQRPGYRIGFVTADASATEDNVIKPHLFGILPDYS
jgi:hypothetical protein